MKTVDVVCVKGDSVKARLGLSLRLHCTMKTSGGVTVFLICSFYCMQSSAEVSLTGICESVSRSELF